MTAKELGETPVFPIVSDADKREHLDVTWGMDTRTWLAGMAMQGLCACPTVTEGSTQICQYAVQYADALLAELLAVNGGLL